MYIMKFKKKKNIYIYIYIYIYVYKIIYISNKISHSVFLYSYMHQYFIDLNTALRTDIYSVDINWHQMNQYKITRRSGT